MADPHAKILTDPPWAVVAFDLARQLTVDRVADFLKAVDDDTDPAPRSGDQPVDIAVLDREASRPHTPQSRSEIEPRALDRA